MIRCHHTTSTGPAFNNRAHLTFTQLKQSNISLQGAFLFGVKYVLHFQNPTSIYLLFPELDRFKTSSALAAHISSSVQHRSREDREDVRLLEEGPNDISASSPPAEPSAQPQPQSPMSEQQVVAPASPVALPFLNQQSQLVGSSSPAANEPSEDRGEALQHALAYSAPSKAVLKLVPQLTGDGVALLIKTLNDPNLRGGQVLWDLKESLTT